MNVIMSLFVEQILFEHFLKFSLYCDAKIGDHMENATNYLTDHKPILCLLSNSDSRWFLSIIQIMNTL